MIYRELDWDSAFFALSVAALTWEPGDTVDTVKSSLALGKYDLCYVFLPADLDMDIAPLGGQLMDRKVTFFKSPLSATEESGSVCAITELTDELFSLAVSSGWMSRFYLDTGLRALQPQLYRKWVCNCFNSPTGGVWGYWCGDKLAGMVCASVTPDGCGKLGLISVAPEFRGRGIARQLMETAERFYGFHHAVCAEVVTQKGNRNACRLYDRCGYREKNEVNVWHVWKSSRNEKRL